MRPGIDVWIQGPTFVLVELPQLGLGPWHTGPARLAFPTTSG